MRRRDRMACMYLKLAWRNVGRSVKDYSVYFFTLAFASCLLYSFTASGDYLLALDLSSEQRGVYGAAEGVMQAFSVFSVIVFMFLVIYANRFILRRRSNEFAMYGLLGMEPAHIMRILAYENLMVGVLALMVGLGAGVLLSPAFAGIAALVFDAPYHVILTFSMDAALWTSECFAVIMIGAMLLGTRDIRKRSLLQLMNASRLPEKPKHASRSALGVQTALAFAALVLVWGTCLFQPISFVVYILPLGVIAVFATGVIFRAWTIWRTGRAVRKPVRYLQGLRCFVVRQIEAKVSSSACAMGCTCVLIAVALCMIVAGFAFSIGMRTSVAGSVVASSLAPIGYVGIFYGMTFLVAAAAVLALQQLAEGADSMPRYRILGKLGCDSALMRHAIWSQTGVYFATPLAFALVHCAFGLALVGFLAYALGSSSFAVIVAGAIGGTVALVGIYYVITSRTCERMLLRDAG